MSGLPPQKIKELKAFIDSVHANPQLLHVPELEFFKNYLITLGADIPEPKPQEKPQEKAQHRPPKQQETKPKEEKIVEEPQEVEEPEEPEEPDDGLYAEDNDTPLGTGDGSKEVTDEMLEQASNKRHEAMQAQEQGNTEDAIKLLTEAIMLNPKGALLYGTRAQLLVNQKKTKCCDKGLRYCYKD